MAKLNQTEITAIASQIADDIKKKNREYNKKLESEGYSKWSKKFLNTARGKMLKGFCENSKVLNEITDHFNWGGRIFEQKLEPVLREFFKKENNLEYKNTNISENLIKRDIIIRQAQGDGIKDLIKELTEKYS